MMTRNDSQLLRHRNALLPVHNTSRQTDVFENEIRNGLVNVRQNEIRKIYYQLDI